MAEKRWTIWVCPSCGSRRIDEEHPEPDGEPMGWYCEGCDEREFECREVEVIPADSPNVLSRAEIRTLCAGVEGDRREGFGPLMERLANYEADYEGSA